MTIIHDWCATCEESCHDHGTICTICGDALQARPPSTRRTARSAATTSTSTTRTTTTTATDTTTLHPAISEYMVQELRDSNQELTVLLSNLRQRVSDIRQQVSDIRGMTQLNSITNNTNNANNTTNIDDDPNNWFNNVPAEAMDPAAAQHRSKPTSKQVLASIPRIVLHESSSLLQKVTIELVLSSSNSMPMTKTFDAIAADFGPSIDTAPRTISNAKLVLAGTGKHAVPKSTSTTTDTSHHFIYYMERGDNITFCQKALLAQEAGATAVIVGNNTNASWPFVMQDTKGEAKAKVDKNENNHNDHDHDMNKKDITTTKTNDSIQLLNIPIVMISQSSGRELVQYYHQMMTTNPTESSNNTTSSSSLSINYHMQPMTKECIICVESCSIGNTVLQLPKCLHVFHEQCALLWLEHHNSCPYCRQELPMEQQQNDNQYYSQRRQQDEVEGLNNDESGGGSTERNSEGFYG